MKKLFYIFSIICSMFLVSCEENITLDFDKNVPRLVIQGNIFTGEDIHRIKLSTTTDFYSDVFPKIDNATVSLTNLQTNEVFEYQNTGGGNYIVGSFFPEVNETYQLTVEYNNEIYTATSTILPSPEIINVDQNDDGGIIGDSYEFRFNFQDNPNEENYYLVQMISPIDNLFGVTDDKFTDGKIMNDLYFYDKEDIKPGDDLNHYINSISKEYHQYLSKLLSISSGSGNPFSSPTGTIKGNIVNQTNQSNFALGYFHLAKRNHYTYTVK